MGGREKTMSSIPFIHSFIHSSGGSGHHMDSGCSECVLGGVEQDSYIEDVKTDSRGNFWDKFTETPLQHC